MASSRCIAKAMASRKERKILKIGKKTNPSFFPSRHPQEMNSDKVPSGQPMRRCNREEDHQHGGHPAASRPPMQRSNNIVVIPVAVAVGVPVDSVPMDAREQQLNDANIRIRQLETELLNQRHENELLRQEVDSLRSQNRTLRFQNDRKASQISWLNSQLYVSGTWTNMSYI